MGRHSRSKASLGCVAIALSIAGCGARTGLLVPPVDVAPIEADVALMCRPVDDGCGTDELCGNGADDDCDGMVDEGCACSPGAVQSCFAGPPGRRRVGACVDGAQSCGSSGVWNPCHGGVLPHHDDTCDGADNLCTGCSHDLACPITCPAPGDPRVPNGAPFRPYALDGRAFFAGEARGWQWSIEGGPCDALSQQPSYFLARAQSPDAVFTPRISGDYTVTLDVVSASGEHLRCTFVVHVAGPGVRIEMCYPENTTRDLDLYVHRPGNTRPWFDEGTSSVYSASADACSWHNCEAHLRSYIGTTSLPRADWGYSRSPLAECENGPYGSEWRALGYCANPRLDLDNNLREGIGVPENINIDTPRDGDAFRVMVQNFSGHLAHPLVNVYCGGRRVATFGETPDEVADFHGDAGDHSFGAMWRVADVTAHVDARGTTTGCEVAPIHPAGAASGYAITQGDPSY